MPTLPDDVELAPFKPSTVVFEELGLTACFFEDAPYVAVPLHPKVYHFIDELRAMDDNRLVGIQFWIGTPKDSP